MLYSPRTISVEPAPCKKIDIGIVLILEENSKSFITSEFITDEIFPVIGETKRLWIEILNQSYLKPITVKRNELIGFLVVEPENLKMKHETAKKKAINKGKTTFCWKKWSK